MSTITRSNTPFLVDTDTLSMALQERVKEVLHAQKVVKILDFPKGDTLNIASVGKLYAQDYVEDTDTTYQKPDTGNHQHTVDFHKIVPYAISLKKMEDEHLIDALEVELAMAAEQAIMEAFETNVYALSNQQTADDPNVKNGQPHRFVGTGTGQTASFDDIRKAALSLKKAGYGGMPRIGIVDPTTSLSLEQEGIPTFGTRTNPQYENVIPEGLSDGMRFIANLSGFDIYESEFLPEITSESIASKTVTNGVANLFMPVGMYSPFYASWRRMPVVTEDFNHNREEYEYRTSARYGLSLGRDDALVTLLTNSSNVGQA